MSVKKEIMSDLAWLEDANAQLEQDKKLLLERLDDATALLHDKNLLEVYSENRRLKKELNLSREWDKLRPDDWEEEDPWILSYGDMVTLLLVIFVFLFSFSMMDRDKFKQAAESLVQTFQSGYSGKRARMEGPAPGAGEVEGEDSGFMQKMKAEMEDLVKNGKLHDDIDVTWKGGELIIAIKARIFFESGRADLAEKAIPILKEISTVLKTAPRIAVEGHTDDVPIHTPEFPSNWELSTARASRVARFFIEEGNIDPEKLMAVGFAQYVPLVPNSDEDNRASNRRVEIKVRHPKNKGKE